jgi:alkylation response protein AidB-like acyl-CoA dehydrogenase
MDATFTEEQEMLADTAARLADKLGVSSVHDLESAVVAGGIEQLAAGGLLGLSVPVEAGGSGGSAVEVAIVAEALGRRLAPVPFVGTVLAIDLLATAGADTIRPFVSGEARVGLALRPDLTTMATDSHTAIGWDVAGATLAVGLKQGAQTTGAVLLSLEGGQPLSSADLTRQLVALAPGCASVETSVQLDRADISRWQALALTTLCADMVGVMHGALTMAVEHAKQRIQFGAPIGSFQAVQHLCAEHLVSLEAARSATYHSAWAVGGLPAEEALLAARTAKAYISRHARTVTEAALQVQGGIGHTWESLGHVYLRRALLDRATLGDEAVQIAMLTERLVGAGPRAS